MSGIAQFTSKFKVAGSGNQRTASSGAIRRQRQTLACNQCRKAKLRCDKARPCGSCVKRDGGGCSYDSQACGKAKSATEDRLDHLEAMVNQLLNAPHSSEAEIDIYTLPDLPHDQVDAFDGGKMDSPQDHYPTVVEEIMDSIRQLRLALPVTDKTPDLAASSFDEDRRVDECIFGLATAYSREAILSRYMPSDQEVDLLLAAYFGGETFIQPFIHAQHFQRQYREFKKDHFLTTSALWLSTLFSILAISAMLPSTVCSEPDAQASSHHFQTAAGQCLVLGRYHKTQRDAPEALLLYAHCKGLRTLDPSRECGAIICVAVRHAYELGYHRDPDTFGRFTVFEGEMRRRFWACCKQVDTMVSFQLGLPSNIIFDNCDTKSPHNLLDSDFDIDTEVLMPSRPESEATPMLWFIVKDRMMPVFARICQTALSLRTKTEEEVLELDGEVKQAYTGIPAVLRWRPTAESVADPPFLIMSRLFLELLYLKSLCILHRRYMMRGSTRSVCQCVESASRIVRSVVDVHREFQPGSKLQGVCWMFKGIAMTDFLLGATILCLYVSLECRGDIPRASASVPTTEVLTLIRDARSVCLDRSFLSADARKVALSIQLTLRSAEEKVNLFAEAPAGVAELDFSNWTDFDQDRFPYLENQFNFNELDPFHFMGSAS